MMKETSFIQPRWWTRTQGLCFNVDSV